MTATTVKMETIADFAEVFAEKYDFLYSAPDMHKIPGYFRALNDFDRIAQEQPQLLAEFNRYRMGAVSSDREAAAFVLSYDELLAQQ